VGVGFGESETAATAKPLIFADLIDYVYFFYSSYGIDF
jgi:hypothetical protein